MQEAALFIATLATVFLLVFQQQNVHHRYIFLGNITSALISVAQVSFTVITVDIGLWSLIYVVPGGMVGFSISMYVHPMIKARMDQPSSMQKWQRQQAAFKRITKHGV